MMSKVPNGAPQRLRRHPIVILESYLKAGERRAYAAANFNIANVLPASKREAEEALRNHN